MIFHVIDSLNPRMGGLPKSAVSMALAQGLEGGEVGIGYYAQPEEEREISGQFSDLPGFSELRRFGVKREQGGDAWTCRGFLALLEEEKPALLHLHGLWEPLLWRVQKWAAGRKIPYVITPHSMLHPWQNRNRRFAKWVVRKPLGVERLWHGAAWFHALSDAESGHIQSAGLSRIRVFPNGVFPEEDQEPVGEELPGLSGRSFLLFLGRLDRVKGLPVLLEAFGKIAEAHSDLFLVMAGPDYGMRDALAKRAEELGLTHRVVFPGLLRGREKWAALHQTVCYCLPSLSEGCSMSALEAGLAGAPMAVSAACDLEEWFTEGAAVRLPEAPEKMADTLVSLAAWPQEGAVMGRKARALVRERYDWRRIAQAQNRAYAETLNQQAG